MGKGIQVRKKFPLLRDTVVVMLKKCYYMQIASLSLWRGKGVVVLYGNRYTVFRAYLVDLLISLRVVYGGILSHTASSAAS